MATIPTAILDALTGEGVTAETKPNTIKGTYKELTGEQLTDEQVEEYRTALREYQGGQPGATAPAGKVAAEATKQARKRTAKKNTNKEEKVATKTKRAPKTDAKARKATKTAKALPKEPKPVKEPLTEEQRAKIAKAIVKENVAAGKPGWENVSKVTETNDNGVPLRVEIKCADQISDACDKTREVAVQDLFQVKRCRTCQKRSISIYRNELAKRKRAAAKAEAGEAKAPKMAAKKATRKTAKTGRKPAAKKAAKSGREK